MQTVYRHKSSAALYCIDDVQWTARTALRYVETMPDSQTRCLLYAMARRVQAEAPTEEAVKVAGPGVSAEVPRHLVTPVPS